MSCSSIAFGSTETCSTASTRISSSLCRTASRAHRCACLGFVLSTTLQARLPNGDTYYPNRTPKWNYGAGTEYTLALGDKGTLTPRVDWTYQSKIYFNNSAGFQDGYGLLSARLTWAAPDDKWSVALSGTNLTKHEQRDVEIIADRVATMLMGRAPTLIRPRRVKKNAKQRSVPA